MGVITACPPPLKKEDRGGFVSVSCSLSQQSSSYAVSPPYDLPPEVPYENITTLYNTFAEFGTYPLT